MHWLRALYLQVRYNPLLTFVLGALCIWGMERTAEQFVARRGLPAIALAAAFLVLAVLLYQAVLLGGRRLLHRRDGSVGVPPQARRGLILLLGKPATARKAIEHHRQRLEFIWFIVTTESAKQVNPLLPHLRAYATAREWVTDPWHPAECGNAVARAVSHAQVLGLTPDELICDVTGGTTAMTTGALQACLALKLALQMVPAKYDAELQALTPLDVIEIRLEKQG